MKRSSFKPRKRKCPVCGDSFMPFNSMQKSCTKTACAIEVGRDIQRKVFKADIRERKEKLKSKSDWLREAQQAFNAFIRIRDEREPCISCQRYHDGQYHAGHYRTVKAASQLRFNLWNNNKQCSACNLHLSGNITEYRINLVKKIGVERVEALENNNSEARYSIEYAQRIKRIFNKRTRLYKKLFR